MSKAAINALAIALNTYPHDVQGKLADALEFAEEFFTENADVFGPPVIVDYQGRPAGVQPVASVPAIVAVEATEERARRMYVPARGDDGLTDRQRAGAARNIAACPNCQQPVNNHAPACSVASGEDPRARTTGLLPPLA